MSTNIILVCFLGPPSGLSGLPRVREGIWALSFSEPNLSWCPGSVFTQLQNLGILPDFTGKKPLGKGSDFFPGRLAYLATSVAAPGRQVAPESFLGTPKLWLAEPSWLGLHLFREFVIALSRPVPLELQAAQLVMRVLAGIRSLTDQEGREAPNGVAQRPPSPPYSDLLHPEVLEFAESLRPISQKRTRTGDLSSSTSGPSLLSCNLGSPASHAQPGPHPSLPGERFGNTF